MVGHGGSSAGSYLTDPTSPIPSLCASIVATSTLRVKEEQQSSMLIIRMLMTQFTWSLAKLLSVVQDTQMTK